MKTGNSTIDASSNSNKGRKLTKIELANRRYSNPNEYQGNHNNMSHNDTLEEANQAILLM